jgi:succinoglycan biosynthesis transport protein ExoP
MFSVWPRDMRAHSPDMKSDDYSAADEPTHAQTHAMDWQEYYHAIRKRLWMVILCVVLGGIGAAIYMNGQKQTFEARSVLLIDQGQSKVLEKVQSVREEQIISLDMINTVVDLIRSFPFAERVATRLKLNADPRFFTGLTDKPAATLTVDGAAGLLVHHVNASYRPKTRLIDIFVTHPDPAMAIELANAYADEYLRYGFDQQADANKAANQFLLDDAERLRKQLRVSEEAMQSFRERERSASLEDMQQASEVKLADESKEMTELENKLFQLDSDLKEASAKPGDVESLLRLPSVAAQPRVAEMNQAIEDIERQFTLLKQRYRAKHPAYIATQTQLDSLQRNRAELLTDVVGLLRGERQRMQAQYDDLKSAKDQQESNLLSITGKSVEYNDLRRELETNKTMYNSVLARVAEIDVTKGMTDSQVKIQERAVGAAPIMASVPKVYSLGVALGLVVGVGVALGCHFLDQSVKTVDQAESLAGVPVLAAVPKKKKSNPRILDIVADRDGLVAESFRSLRATLAMPVHAGERRIFLFTSALPSEGKTFCSSNFAATLAQQGFRTLLIDGDLRRPMVSRIFFGESRQPGLFEILAGQAKFPDAVLASKVDGLSILPAGLRGSNPAELLSSPKLQEVFRLALLTYDRVVIDTAPILAVSDSLLIAPHVDVTCLVLRSFKTPRKVLQRALKSLEEIHCHPTGIVLNFLPSGASNYYYYSGKYHGVYGEKGVYGT